jgi:hypothetical protein
VSSCFRASRFVPLSTTDCVYQQQRQRQQQRGRTRHGTAKTRYRRVPGEDHSKLAGLSCSIVGASIKPSYITEQHLLGGTKTHVVSSIRQDPTTWHFVPGLGWPPTTRTQAAAMSEVGKPQGHLARWAWVVVFDAAGLAVWNWSFDGSAPCLEDGKRHPGQLWHDCASEFLDAAVVKQLESEWIARWPMAGGDC